MKPSIAFILGLATGLGLFAAFNFWRTPTQLSAIPVPPPAPAHTQSTASSSAVSASAQSTPTPDIPQDTLESALREIREAGMVVIPQEFARFLMPSLLSTHPEPAVRQILQLDEREASALAKARMNFDRALQQTIDAHLQVTEVKDGVVTATLPAFKEERQKLIADWRAESLAVLDTDSAAMASHIDFDRAMDGFFQGRTDLTVTIKPSPDSKKFAIDYRGQTVNGDHRQNHRLQMGMPSSQLLKQFPSLQPHFPQLSANAKP